MASFNLSAIQLGEPLAGTKGAKSVPITSDGKAVVWLPGAHQVAFEPSAFSGEDVSRVNLVLRASPGVVEALTALDAYLVGLLALDSVKVFGKPLTEDEVRARFCSSLKTSEKYAPTFKAKINLSGRGQVKLWDADRQARPAPSCWTACTVRPRIVLKSCWASAKECGALFEATDLLVDEAPQSCPF